MEPRPHRFAGHACGALAQRRENSGIRPGFGRLPQSRGPEQIFKSAGFWRMAGRPHFITRTRQRSFLPRHQTARFTGELRVAPKGQDEWPQENAKERKENRILERELNDMNGARDKRVGKPKAPEGWRTPRRFALFKRCRTSRQRLGVRQSSAAFQAQ